MLKTQLFAGGFGALHVTIGAYQTITERHYSNVLGWGVQSARWNRCLASDSPLWPEVSRRERRQPISSACKQRSRSVFGGWQRYAGFGRREWWVRDFGRNRSDKAISLGGPDDRAAKMAALTPGTVHLPPAFACSPAAAVFKGGGDNEIMEDRARKGRAIADHSASDGQVGIGCRPRLDGRKHRARRLAREAGPHFKLRGHSSELIAQRCRSTAPGRGRPHAILAAPQRPLERRAISTQQHNVGMMGVEPIHKQAAYPPAHKSFVWQDAGRRISPISARAGSWPSEG